jgi:LacI family transcriptional regulator
MTVSRALNGKAEVSADVKQRILECAERLGYRPNRWARSLVTQRSHMIGVVIPEIAHSFFAEVLSGAEDALDKSGYDILLCHSRLDAARERSEVEALTASHIDGLIVAPVQPEKSPELFLELADRDVPFVLVDRFFPGYDFPSVRLDDAAAGYEATMFLLKLGHRRIAHISGPPLSPVSLRKRGYQRALREYPDAIREKGLILSGRLDMESGREAMKRLLLEKPRPTAVFAANDPEAVGAIWACREAGLDVPGDVSVMGAGNIEGVYHPNPFVTTIDWPRQELGRLAARILLDRIDKTNKEPKHSHVYKPQLLVRHSTASPRQR